MYAIEAYGRTGYGVLVTSLTIDSSMKKGSVNLPVRRYRGRRQESFVESFPPPKKRANRSRFTFCAVSDLAHDGSKTRSTSKIPLTEWSSH
jgi:hypothetical protein